MMKKNAWGLKAVIFLAVFGIAAVPLPCYADPAAETTGNAGPDITLRREAPVYTGPFEEGDLEPLSVDDFEEFGDESESPRDQYRQYQKMLEVPAPGIQVPYRLRIVDRDLALDDFLGFNVPEELAEARYDGYLRMIPASVDGRTVHYVYVYHRSIARQIPDSEGGYS